MVHLATIFDMPCIYFKNSVYLKSLIDLLVSHAPQIMFPYGMTLRTHFTLLLHASVTPILADMLQRSVGSATNERRRHT
jgi:hypothetical protein